jgi:hypothetical protein
MYISVTGDDESFYSEGFVVRFYKTDETNWVANFKPGWTSLNAIYEFQEQPNILVIAGGKCYLMNPNEEKPGSTFGVGYESVIETVDGKFILQAQTNLTIIERNCEHWDTERISWDGIKDLKLEGNLVTGLSFDPLNHKDEWVKFVVDLEKRNVKGGSYSQYEIDEATNGKLLAPDQIIKIVSILFAGLFLFQLYKEFGMISFMFTDSKAKWDFSMILYFLPLVLVPVAIILFFKRKRAGWTLLAIFLTYAAVSSVGLFILTLNMEPSGIPALDSLSPQASPATQIFNLLFFAGILWVICKHNIREIYFVDKKYMFKTIGISVVLTVWTTYEFLI